MTDTCKIDGQIQEIEKLISEQYVATDKLNQRREELLKQRDKSLDTPINRFAKATYLDSRTGVELKSDYSDRINVTIDHKYGLVMDDRLERAKTLGYELDYININKTNTILKFKPIKK